MVGFGRLLWSAALFAALLSVWVVLDGMAALVVGVPAAALAAWAAVRLAPTPPLPWRPLALVGFVWYFLVESVRGGADVAWRAVRPDLPIHPHLIRFDVALPPGPARTLLAGVVSLLPGTLTADATPDGAHLTVHAIGPEPQRAVAELEARIAHLYGAALEVRA